MKNKLQSYFNRCIPKRYLLALCSVILSFNLYAGADAVITLQYDPEQGDGSKFVDGPKNLSAVFAYDYQGDYTDVTVEWDITIDGKSIKKTGKRVTYDNLSENLGSHTISATAKPSGTSPDGDRHDFKESSDSKAYTIVNKNASNSISVVAPTASAIQADLNNRIDSYISSISIDTSAVREFVRSIIKSEYVADYLNSYISTAETKLADAKRSVAGKATELVNNLMNDFSSSAPEMSVKAAYDDYKWDITNVTYSSNNFRGGVEVEFSQTVDVQVEASALIAGGSVSTSFNFALDGSAEVTGNLQKQTDTTTPSDRISTTATVDTDFVVSGDVSGKAKFGFLSVQATGGLDHTESIDQLNVDLTAGTSI